MINLYLLPAYCVTIYEFDCHSSPLIMSRFLLHLRHPQTQLPNTILRHTWQRQFLATPSTSIITRRTCNERAGRGVKLYMKLSIISYSALGLTVEKRLASSRQSSAIRKFRAVTIYAYLHMVISGDSRDRHKAIRNSGHLMQIH